MIRILTSLTARVIHRGSCRPLHTDKSAQSLPLNAPSVLVGLLVVLVSLTSCFGEGGDQIHGMVRVAFPSTAVCQAQQKSIAFRNVSGEELVIGGVAIASGTDPLGDFALQSMTVDGEVIPSTNGVFEDVHIPSGATYSIQVSFLPKLENSSQDAILDIAYKSPEEGVVQVALSGSSTGRVEGCVSGGGGGGGGEVGFDGEMLLNVESLVAATSAIQAPINTDQGQQPFVPIDLPITLNKSAGTVTIPVYTGGGFILPAPREDIPGIGGLIKGSINLTIPTAASGTYDPSTGSIEVPNLLIHMEGDLDFSADLTITLTTERISRSSVSPPINTQALQQFGTPAQWDPIAKEIFGTPIDAESGEVFLVGMTRLENVELKPGARSELSTLPSASMAVLIKGILKEIP